jgi:hypothetical protein
MNTTPSSNEIDIEAFLRLRRLNAKRTLDYIDRICEICGHTKGHDDPECPNCLKQELEVAKLDIHHMTLTAADQDNAIAELNQRLIDRQESFQAQLIRIEDTWRRALSAAKRFLAEAGAPPAPVDNAHGVASACMDVEGWILYDSDGNPVEPWPAGWPDIVDTDFLTARGIRVAP